MNPPKLRSAALVGALAAVAATAWASQPVAVADTLAPNESVVTEAPAPHLAPIVDRSVMQPRITVEQRRLTRDQRIQSDVMDKLGEAGTISGKIGVQTRDATVTLVGYTSTSGQADRAGRAARGVMGVRYVDNQIRPRVGGSV